MGERVVKISEELYNKVKAKADADGTSMAKALDALAEGDPLPEDIEAFVPSCALEAGVKMPTDYRWIKPLTEVLPPGLRGKMEPYAKVLECAEAKAALKKAAENHLSEVEAADAEATEDSEPEAALPTTTAPPEAVSPAEATEQSESVAEQSPESSTPPSLNSEVEVEAEVGASTSTEGETEEVEPELTEETEED